MSGLPPLIIPLHVKLQMCPEHRCIFLRKQRLWSRYLNGEFRLEWKSEPRAARTLDHQGRIAVWHQNHYLVDANSDKVLKTYCGRTAEGEVTGSGLFDPKQIRVNGLLYGELDKREPHCAFCESGESGD